MDRPLVALHNWQPGMAPFGGYDWITGVEIDINENGELIQPGTVPGVERSLASTLSPLLELRERRFTLYLDLKLSHGQRLTSRGCDVIASCLSTLNEIGLVSYNHPALLDAGQRTENRVPVVGILAGLIVHPLRYTRDAGLSGLMLQPRFLSRALVQEFASAQLELISSACANDAMYAEARHSRVKRLMIDYSFCCEVEGRVYD